MALKPEIAPDGQIYICAACGRMNKDRFKLGDESCYLWATLVYEDSIIMEEGRVRYAKTVEQ